jgi:hypothetical protein
MPTPLSYLTGGLFPLLLGYGPLVAGGAPIFLNPTPKLNPDEDPRNLGLNAKLNLSAQQTSDLQSIIRNPSGDIIVPSTDGFVSIGDGYQLGFDRNTLQGRIQPSLIPDAINGSRNSIFDLATETYTGADVRLLIESTEPAADGRRYAKQLLEATTITVSTHREVSPVRAGGFINPKGFALGKRTIAGTLIVTQFTTEVLFEFLQGIMMTDGSKDSTFTKIDQLPPFNITMIFTNEAGYASQRRLLGVKFITEGVVYSIQDMLVEQTLSWMALDYTPLIPLDLNNLFTPIDPLDQTTRREKTPFDLMAQG